MMEVINARAKILEMEKELAAAQEKLKHLNERKYKRESTVDADKYPQI